jgi:osmotically-inducible protein OsmY
MKAARNALVFGWGLGLMAVSAYGETATNPVDQIVVTAKKPPTPSDAEVSSEVRKRIGEQPSLRFHNIVVRTFNREVYLQGLVDTRLDSARTEAIARTVPGVRKIHNDLAVSGA